MYFQQQLGLFWKKNEKNSIFIAPKQATEVPIRRNKKKKEKMIERRES